MLITAEIKSDITGHGNVIEGERHKRWQRQRIDMPPHLDGRKDQLVYTYKKHIYEKALVIKQQERISSDKISWKTLNWYLMNEK